LLGASFVLDHDYLALRVWSAVPLVAGLAPSLIALHSELSHRMAKRRLPTEHGSVSARWSVPYDTNSPRTVQGPERPVGRFAVHAEAYAGRLPASVVPASRGHDDGGDRTARRTA
jgi:hypothetical protein